MEHREIEINADFAALKILVAGLIRNEMLIDPANNCIPQIYPNGDFLERIEYILRKNLGIPPEMLSSTSSHLIEGTAISPADAVRCLRDFIRTSRFITAVHKAILDLKARFPGEKIRILDAGCGPWALLSITTASQFAPGDVEYSLVDMHDSSIKCCREIIENLGMKDYFDKFLVGDICRINLGEQMGKKPHLIVAEVMNRALMHEPQAAATYNLAPQLEEGGIFLPERIRVTAQLSNSSGQVRLGEVIELTREQAMKAIEDADDFGSNRRLLVEKKYDWPVNLREAMVLLNTDISIYKGHGLNGSNSHISHPFLMGRVKNPEGKKRLGLKIKMGGDEFDTKVWLE